MIAPMTTRVPTTALTNPVVLASPRPRKNIPTGIHMMLIKTSRANVIVVLLDRMLPSPHRGEGVEVRLFSRGRIDHRPYFGHTVGREASLPGMFKHRLPVG